MAQRIRERPLAALWLAVALTVAGRLLDLQWHLTHDEFEGTSEQLQAHWLVWLGVLTILGVTTVAVREKVGGRGFRVALLSAAFYVPVATWHFIEHANRSDPELAHVLIAIAYIGIVVGVVLATLDARRRRRTPATNLRG